MVKHGAQLVTGSQVAGVCGAGSRFRLVLQQLPVICNPRPSSTSIPSDHGSLRARTAWSPSRRKYWGQIDGVILKPSSRKYWEIVALHCSHERGTDSSLLSVRVNWWLTTVWVKLDFLLCVNQCVFQMAENVPKAESGLSPWSYPSTDLAGQNMRWSTENHTGLGLRHCLHACVFDFGIQKKKSMVFFLNFCHGYIKTDNSVNNDDPLPSLSSLNLWFFSFFFLPFLPSPTHYNLTRAHHSLVATLVFYTFNCHLLQWVQLGEVERQGRVCESHFKMLKWVVHCEGAP